jgi:hypothetical protein
MSFNNSNIRVVLKIMVEKSKGKKDATKLLKNKRNNLPNNNLFI